MLTWRTTGSSTPTRSLRSRMLTSRTNTTTLKVITLWRLFVLPLFSFSLPTKECNLPRLTQSFHNLSIKIVAEGRTAKGICISIVVGSQILLPSLSNHFVQVRNCSANHPYKQVGKSYIFLFCLQPNYKWAWINVKSAKNDPHGIGSHIWLVRPEKAGQSLQLTLLLLELNIIS